MRDINGIEQILQILEPHWAEVEDEFERANREFLRLAGIDHEPIGRVLRAHLVIENFLTEYLGRMLGADSVREARLSFAQKVSLLPNGRNGAAFVKPGIVQLNKVRNRFGHDLEHELRRGDLSALYEVLHVARRGERFRDPIAAIEAFAPIACAFLSVPSERVRRLFERAFRHVNVEAMVGA